MEAWQNDPAVTPQAGVAPTNAELWKNDPIVQPSKPPNTSGIQKMAQDNLAANDNKQVSETGEQKESLNLQERLDTAVGQPLHQLMNPDDTTPINPALRKSYTQALQNGSASNFGDFMQTALHTVAPIAAGIIHPVEQANKTIVALSRIGQEELMGISEGAEAGTFFPTSTMIGQTANLPFQIMGAGFSAFQRGAAQVGVETGFPKSGREIAMLPEGMMGMEGIIPHLPPEVAPRPLGPWDNLSGSAPVKDFVAKQTDKEPSAVASSEVDQHIAQGVNHKAPTGEDFKSVSTVTGIPETALHNVFAETGVKPDQVFTDARQNPEIATDVAAGKVPPQYEHLVSPKPVMPEAKTEALNVVKDEATRSFNVVDKDGDHVSGGFDSYEEAQHYIEDEKFKTEERAAIENEQTAKTEEVKPQEQNPELTPSQQRYKAKSENERSDVRSAKQAQLQDLEKQLKPYEDGTYKDLSDDEMEHRDGIRDQVDRIKKESAGYDAIENEEKPKPQDVLTPESEKALEQPKPKENIYAGVEDKIQSMTQDERDLRLESLNKKMEAGIITPKELGEREALSARKQETSTGELDVAGKQGEQLAAANEGRLKPTAAQKAPSEGLFDVAGRGQSDLFSQNPNVIPPSKSGRVTSLKQFLRNNGAKFDESGNLVSMRGGDLDRATELAQEHGYTQERMSIPELQDLVKENPTSTRMQDADRVAKADEAAKQKEWKDPAFVEDQAHKAGIDTMPIKDETSKQRTARLLKALHEFYKSEEGYGSSDAIRQIIGGTIQAAEKFAGKLTGGMFDKLADGYIKTFQPELMGDKALRADAYLAKYKAKLQEAQNSYFRASELEIRRWEKAGVDAQKEWLYDHETGRWSEEGNPDHARTQAMYDALREQEQNAGVGNDAYKDNYLPHQFENPKVVEKYFRSEAMIKKYGKDWFNKASVFKLVQEADRAGFKLKTYNPERMMIARQQASYNMIATMDLLHDFEESGMAKKATAFTIDKKIAKTEQAVADIKEKYKKQFADIEKQKSLVDENGKPIGEPVSAQMFHVQERLADLNKRLDDFKAEKAENKLTPEQMKDLKDGFRVIGPDSKAWIIHQQVGPLWKNAMDMKGLYEDNGLAGSAYRNYMAGKAVYVRTKMLASLFHPMHEAVIDVSSDQASFVHHLIQGGKVGDLLDKKMIPNIGLGKYTAKLQDSPKVTSWNTPAEQRTPEQQADVTRMVEGGFVPTVPRQDIVNFKENFNKAINGIGKNNLRLLGTALEIPSLPMAPLMEHWIPGMKTDSYFQRTDLALARDPSLVTDAGRRSEVFRPIAQDIERNYGEMNRNTQFWNPVVRDIFNATTFSGGWKLAMLQNFRGLAEPVHIAYNWAKTGEFSKEQITHQMLQSYIYTANMLMLGAGLNYLFTGAVGTIKDWINPQTGDKNADGTPVRLRQPAFFNEPVMLLHDIYSDGVVPGTGSFFYHQTLIPGIANNLLGRDFVGRPYITDPTDLHQWKNMGIESISPIALSNQEKAEQRGSGVAEKMGWVGFPMAGAYINQTPFEQKVIGTYYALHQAEGGEYQTKLKAEMRGAVASHDAASQKEIEAEMKHEQMNPSDIANAKKQFNTPFSEYAWKKLSADDQKRLLESATPEEKSKYKVKTQ